MQFKKFQEQKSNSRDNKSNGRFPDVEMEYIDKLFQSMPERVAALMEAKGGFTQY
jgi:hypothetical protein